MRKSNRHLAGFHPVNLPLSHFHSDLSLERRWRWTLAYWTWGCAVWYIDCTGGIWLHSQLPSARVYGDYQLIIAINSSILVNNRTRSAAECHLYWLPPRCAPPQTRVPSRVWSRQIGGAGLDGLRLPCPGGCFVIVFPIWGLSIISRLLSVSTVQRRQCHTLSKQ